VKCVAILREGPSAYYLIVAWRGEVALRSFNLGQRRRIFVPEILLVSKPLKSVSQSPTGTVTDGASRVSLVSLVTLNTEGNYIALKLYDDVPQ
jgi:hypothetical protein